MSSIGYHKIKVLADCNEDKTVTIYNDGEVFAVATVKCRDCCDGSYLVKWLDEFGRYKRFAFNAKGLIKHNPKELGRSNHLITNIKTDWSNERSLGYQGNKSVVLSAANVSPDELAFLSDLYVSPRVFIYIGDGLTDKLEDWVLVKVKGDNIIKSTDNKYKDVKLNVQLPRHYSITSLTIK